MSPITLTFIALGVSADAFAVAVGKGLTMRRIDLRVAASLAVSFGVFQAVMPLLGWLLGSQLDELVTEVDHWVAFGLLAAVGGKMLWEASQGGEAAPGDVLSWRELLLLSAATSIDALAIGISLAFLPVSILPAVLWIGLITTAVALFGVLLGSRAGARWRRPAEVFGGIILIVIGLRVLLDHLGRL